MKTTRSRRRRKNPFLKNALIVLILMLMSAIGTFVALSYSGITVSSKTTSFGLKNIGELATQAGYFTNVQMISSDREIMGVPIPFTQNKYIFSYDGVIKAGIDFSQIELVVDETEHIITVRLPEAIILSSEIDENSIRVYDETKNIFNPLKLDDFNMSLKALKTESQENAIANGLLDNATANAKLLITGFLSGMYDMQVYTIVFE